MDGAMALRDPSAFRCRASLCVMVLFLWNIIEAPLRAQHVDTVQVEEPGLGCMVVKRNKNGEAIGPVSYFDRDNVLRSRMEFKDGKLHGTAIYFYATGRPWAEVPYRHGEMHGVIRTYHPNGAIEAVKPYKKGMLSGERVLRDSTGALVNGEYVEELPYGSGRVYSTCVNGRPHGMVTVTRSGRKVLEGNCTNGMPEGVFYSYDEKGNAIRRDLYEKGRFVSSVSLR